MCKQENDSELVPGIVILGKNTKNKYSIINPMRGYRDLKKFKFVKN